MKELSVIIPFVNEYPQVIFTIQNIAQELMGRVDFEILAINNYCEQARNQGHDVVISVADKISKEFNVDNAKVFELLKEVGGIEPDRGGDNVKASARYNKWLRYLTWTKNLSHWQAKRIGVENSSGKYLWFCDSHCVVSRNGLFGMFEYYKHHEEELNGTIHLPLTYKILESRRLIYKLISDMSKNEVDYRFTGFKPSKSIYEVPCMSCCGVLMSREIYDKVGGWPLELGIYGGGEQFLNFTLAVLGMSKWIYPNGTLFHFGNPRGYHYLYDDYIRNKIIASYIYGGKEFSHKFAKGLKGRPDTLENIYQNVIDRCSDHRALIKNQQRISIGDWVVEWTNRDWIPKE